MKTIDIVLFKIKKEIANIFPDLEVEIEYSDELDEYTIIIFDNEIYTSDAYLSVVADIKLGYLYKYNIFNVLFVCSNKKRYAIQIDSFVYTSSQKSVFNKWNITSDFITIKPCDINSNPEGDTRRLAA